MNKLLGLILVPSTLLGGVINDNLSIDYYNYVKSTYLYNSGTVADDNPVWQTGVDLNYSIGGFSIYGGYFQNYSTDALDYFKKHSGVTEVDLLVGGYYTLDNLTLGCTYEWWVFPGITDKKCYEQLIRPQIVYKWDNLKVGSDFYIYFNDQYSYKLDTMPWISYKLKLLDVYSKELSLTPRVGMCYREKKDGKYDGFSSTNLRVSLNWNGFHLYYQYWWRIDEDVLSNYNRDLAKDCIGFGYTFSF